MDHKSLVSCSFNFSWNWYSFYYSGPIIWRFSTRVENATRYIELKKNCHYMKNFNPDWKCFNPGWNKPRVNRKLNQSKKAKLEARQNQIKSKLKCVILQQFNVISLLLLQILAVIENYQYSRKRILHMSGAYYIFHGIL